MINGILSIFNSSFIYNNYFMIMIILCLGLCIGSFLNVVIYRLPLGLNMTTARSMCPNCKHQLKAQDLVPVISYFMRGGRCHYCKTPIALRYPLIELLTGVLYVTVFLRFGYQLDTLLGLILVSLLVVIAMIDIDYRRIPNLLNILVLMLALLRMALGAVSLTSSLYGFVSALVIFLVIILLGKLLHAVAIGMGDIKLALAAALYLGFRATLNMLIVTFILAGLYISVAIITKRLKLKSQISFAPFIVSGIILSLLANKALAHLLI